VGNNAGSWRQRAEELWSSGSALSNLFDEAISYDPPDPIEALDYPDAAGMLRAMALECFLKARAVDRGMVLARGGRFRPVPGIRQHDLVALAGAVGFEMSDLERAVMKRVARWITAGRYPIQQRWSEQERIRPDGLREFLCVGWHPNWDHVCEHLVERLRRPGSAPA
jgi:hypothetical protein